MWGSGGVPCLHSLSLSAAFYGPVLKKKPLKQLLEYLELLSSGVTVSFPLRFIALAVEGVERVFRAN